MHQSSNLAADVPALVEATARHLRAASVTGRLSALAAGQAARLVKGILSITGVLDDSISTPTLGSLFDRNDPLSPINLCLALIADAYGSRHVHASTTGTSALNAAAVMTMVRPGETMIVDRGCHVSVGAGVVHAGAIPRYVTGRYDAETGLRLPLSTADLAMALDAHPDARAVVITDPTYNGLRGHVAAMVSLCRGRGVTLMVDEAHGPHHRFLRRLGLPMDAVTAGADIVTQSTHKVMSALNQASLIHFAGDELSERYEAVQSLGFQSTSFSYPILASLEHAVLQMCEQGEELWGHALALADDLRAGLDRIPGLRVVGGETRDLERVSGLDRTRVTVNVRELGLTGWQVEAMLAERAIIAEMASLDTVLFLLGPCHDRAAAAIGAAMADIAAGRRGRPREVRAAAPPSPEVVISPRDAFFARRRLRVPRDQAIGKIAAETIGAYPPGQTVIGPGERVSRDAVEFLVDVLRHGGHLKRAHDDGFRTIEIIDTL